MPKLHYSLLFSIIFLTYSPSFWNTFIWDDEQFIQKNTFLTSLRYLPQIFTTNTIAGAGEASNYYRPLTTVSFLIDRLIWGLRPFGFHLTNTVLHGGVAVALMYLLISLGVRKKVAFVMSLLFAVHPLQTEAVVYMNSRGDSLYALLLILALICFVKVLHQSSQLFLNGTTWQFRLNTRRWAILTVFFFCLSILAKEIAVAGVGLMVVLFIKEEIEKNVSLSRVWIKQKWSVLTLFFSTAVLAGYLGLRLTVLNFQDFTNFYGAQNTYTSSLAIRLFTFCRAFLNYWQLIIVPYPLHMERSLPLVTSFTSPWVLAAGGLVILILLIGVWEWGCCHSIWVLFGLSWLLILLGPVSGIVPINGLIYEHWLYLPIVGTLLIAYGFLLALFSFIKLQQKHFLVKFLNAFSVFLVGVYILLTLRQNWIWRSPLSFYPYTLQYTESARIQNNLAMAYDENGDHAAAIQHYLRAIAVGDDYPQTHYNLAQTYVQINKPAEAEQQYLRTLQMNSDFDLAYPALARLYFEHGEYVAALNMIEVISRKYPQQGEFVLAKSQILWVMGKPAEAKQLWQQLLQQNPGNAQLQQLIGQIEQTPTASVSAK